MKKSRTYSVVRIVLTLSGLCCLMINMALESEHNWWLVAGLLLIDAALIIKRRENKDRPSNTQT